MSKINYYWLHTDYVVKSAIIIGSIGAFIFIQHPILGGSVGSGLGAILGYIKARQDASEYKKNLS